MRAHNAASHGQSRKARRRWLRRASKSPRAAARLIYEIWIVRATTKGGWEGAFRGLRESLARRSSGGASTCRAGAASFLRRVVWAAPRHDRQFYDDLCACATRLGVALHALPVNLPPAGVAEEIYEAWSSAIGRGPFSWCELMRRMFACLTHRHGRADAASFLRRVVWSAEVFDDEFRVDAIARAVQLGIRFNDVPVGGRPQRRSVAARRVGDFSLYTSARPRDSVGRLGPPRRS